MEENELLDPFNRLLEDGCPPERTRGIEAGAGAGIGEIWPMFEESGFLDALVPEDAGGAGLALPTVAPLFQALGHHAIAAPVGETIIARALLAAAGIERPAGPIVLAVLAGGCAANVPLALVAEHALVEHDGMVVLTPIAQADRQATGAHGSLAASLTWTGAPQGPSFAAPNGGLLRRAGAMLRAAQIAGAADRLLQMSATYANERVQFGKPIGKQQVIQQQLAIMAEQTVAARIAAQIGCAGNIPPTLETAAVAKHVASAAASQIANIAHAVHGAIGISEEYDLQLFSRRLHEWRLADGAESYWAAILGEQRLAAAQLPSVDFVRERINIGGGQD